MFRVSVFWSVFIYSICLSSIFYVLLVIRVEGSCFFGVDVYRGVIRREVKGRRRII